MSLEFWTTTLTPNWITLYYGIGFLFLGFIITWIWLWEITKTVKKWET